MSATTRPPGRTTGQTTVADDSTMRAILGALEDDDCRAVLEATSEEAMSASELSERCDLPLSTTYRKLDALTETGLLAERTRLSPDGKHVSEYLRAVDDVLVSADAADGFELTVSERRVDGV